MFLFKLLKTETDGAYLLPHGHRCLRPRQRVRVFMVYWEELRTVEMWKIVKRWKRTWSKSWNTSEAPLSLCPLSARRPFRNRARSDDWVVVAAQSGLDSDIPESVRAPGTAMVFPCERPSPNHPMGGDHLHGAKCTWKLSQSTTGLMSRLMEIIMVHVFCCS